MILGDTLQGSLLAGEEGGLVGKFGIEQPQNISDVTRSADGSPERGAVAAHCLRSQRTHMGKGPSFFSIHFHLVASAPGKTDVIASIQRQRLA